MRIDDRILFAPGVPFDQLRQEDEDLLHQVRDRFEGFFFSPAENLCDSGHGFAAGLLLLAALESVCRLDLRRLPVEDTRRADYRAFCIEHFDGLDEEAASVLYSDFRCGLVHEGRIKRGGQFSLETARLMEGIDGIPVVNPKELLRGLREALLRVLDTAAETKDGLKTFSAWLFLTFWDDLPG